MWQWKPFNKPILCASGASVEQIVVPVRAVLRGGSSDTVLPLLSVRARRSALSGPRTKPQPARPAQHPRSHRATSKEQPQIHCHDPGAGRQRLLPPPPPGTGRSRNCSCHRPARGTRAARAQRQPVKIPGSGTGYKTIRPGRKPDSGIEELNV